MGTKGFITVTDNQVNDNTLILGVTSDGDAHNMRWLAQKVLNTAEKMRVLTEFRKSDAATISKVFEKVCEETDNWCFTDIHRNASWVSYSAVLNPKLGTIRVYEGNLEYQIAS